ncbi:hypothetical protein EATG_00943 [Escherichia coli H605]|uniref:Uncharacterized protein n=1 Tax=Escherichia coli H605 TaxID=656410 RepID=A0AAJ3P110_ECOLX|nr:hypothetical protein EATG_00943 [Escherichia coli H605]
MTAQQIADVLDVDLNRLKENREAMTDFYAAIRIALAWLPEW